MKQYSFDLFCSHLKMWKPFIVNQVDTGSRLDLACRLQFSVS